MSSEKMVFTVERITALISHQVTFDILTCFASQEILLLKGDGEVKLNMAIGKGEQALKSSNEEGQKVIQTELQTLKDVWNDIISTSVNWQR